MTDDQARGLVGAVTEATSRTLMTLPGQFLALVLINAVFITGLLWFLAKQNDSRERLMTPVLTACAKSVPVEALALLRRPSSAE